MIGGEICLSKAYNFLNPFNGDNFHVGLEFDTAKYCYNRDQIKRKLPSPQVFSEATKVNNDYIQSLHFHKCYLMINPRLAFDESHQRKIAKTSLNQTDNAYLEFQKQAIESVQSTESHIKKWIEDELGGTEQPNVERFEKEYGLTMQSILDATFREIMEMQKGSSNVGFGGLNLAGIRKWKILAEFSEDRTLTKLFIGRLHKCGSTTKVYFNLKGEALLVAKKGQNNSKQLLNSYGYLLFLNKKFANEPRKLLNIPFKPTLAMAEDRPVLITKKGTCVDTIFRNPPIDLRDIVKRLSIIIDIAYSIALINGSDVIHGDVKPSNMLISPEGNGQIHDLGGSRLMSTLDNRERAAEKYKSLSRTTQYTHYKDHSIKVFEDVNFSKLGFAGDVFALGISTLEALKGMYDENGVRKLPLPSTYYCVIKGEVYVNSKANSTKNILNIKMIPKEIRQELNELINWTLAPNFRNRITIENYIEGLFEIYKKLVQIDNPTST